MRCLTARFEDQTLRFPLPKGKVQVGSSPENEIRLPFPGVSAVHAAVEPVAGGLAVRDVGSKNGLFVTGKRRSNAFLAPGAEVGIGRGVLFIEEADTSDIELAFQVETGTAGKPRPRGKSETETASGEPDAAQLTARDVLRFVRNCEDARSRGEADPATVFAKAAPILGATGIGLWQRNGDGTVSFVSAWGLPPHGEESEDRRIVTWRSPEHNRSREKRDTGLSVAFRTLAEAAEPWRADLVAYLGSLLTSPLPRRSDGPSPAPVERTLSLPAGMVAGCSPAMRDLFHQLRAAAGSPIDILLTGETGTGKELVARTIHSSSEGRSGSLVTVNCAAIPAELLEAELFGVHGRIATGVDPRPGRLLLAEGGTVFLDEVGELAPSLQAKLLRFLQEREVHAIGAPAPKRVDLRVIAATNRNLREEVRLGRFRADLYYRLRGLELYVPPLRERREDIPELALAFVRQAAAAAGKEIRGVTRKALAALLEHDWPGNVRELEADVRRAVLLCPDGGSVGAEHLPLREPRSQTGAPEAEPPRHEGRPDSEPTRWDGRPLADQLAAQEQSILEKALAAADGNRTEAAKRLGLKRTTLVMRLKKLALMPTRGGDR